MPKETAAAATPAEVPTEATPRKKRQLAKQLAKFTPFVKWHIGLIVCGVIERKFKNDSNYGEKQNIEVRLLDPVEYTNGDGEVISLVEGDLLNVGQSAGLNTAMTLPAGATVQIECTGKTEMGKGKKDAWDFDVEYE